MADPELLLTILGGKLSEEGKESQPKEATGDSTPEDESMMKQLLADSRSDNPKIAVAALKAMLRLAK